MFLCNNSTPQAVGGKIGACVWRVVFATVNAMKERWHALANAILDGETQSSAYARIYGVKSVTARANCSRLMQKPAFVSLMADLREAREADDKAIRAEIVAGHLSDMRNEALPASERRAARIALAKVYGLECLKSHVKVENSEDDLRFQAILQKCQENLEKAAEARVNRARSEPL